MTDPRPACGNTLHAAHWIILRPLKLGFRSFYFSANCTIHAFGTVSVWHWKHRKVECNAGCQCTHNAFGNCGKIWFKHTMWEQNVHITYVKMASICTQFVYRLCKIWGQSLFLQKFLRLKPKIVPTRGSDIPRLPADLQWPLQIAGPRRQLSPHRRQERRLQHQPGGELWFVDI